MNNPLVSEIIYPFSYNIIDVPLSGIADFNSVIIYIDPYNVHSLLLLFISPQVGRPFLQKNTNSLIFCGYSFLLRT